jgi:hypothetical protein
MAKLPNADAASIDPRKITHYLLDLRHPDGGPKAAYFMLFGFREDDPEPLIEALLEHGRFNEVVRLQKTAFGTNYIVEGPLSAVDGRKPRLRTVWTIDNGGGAPRFVTAIPLKGKS